MSTEPVAVVGIALDFPQGVRSEDAFWELLREGKSARGEVPADRFNVDTFYHPDPKRLGHMSSRHGHFVTSDVLAFDAPFFGLSPAEAACMDPQQRVLLETTFHALQNAGLKRERLAGSNTSVFVAAGMQDFGSLLRRDLQQVPQSLAVGVGQTMLANRISHFWDLKGPSMTLDTACSSSIYALHLACQSLRTGESEASIVGSSNLILAPDSMSIPLADGGFASAFGASRSFDQAADGYARGEGTAVVILKRLSKAIQDGDFIRSVIRATGVNVDGRTPSITQPGGEAQKRLIAQTYASANLALSDTAYVEAHGTGTKVGDPIEANAIGEAFAQDRRNRPPLVIGAVKSNIGHLESASGLASLIKTVLVLEKGLIPPNVWFRAINPGIRAEELNLKFPSNLLAWPSAGVRRASINNFGYGGANGHVVMDDALSFLASRSMLGMDHLLVDSSSAAVTHLSSGLAPKSEKGMITLPLTAADEKGVDRVAVSLAQWIEKLSACELGIQMLQRLCCTLYVRHSHLSWRTSVTADSVDSMLVALKSARRPTRAASALRNAFVFTGQGVQWPLMGSELLRYTVFRGSLATSDRILKSLGSDWTATAELSTPDNGRINSPAYAQPLCAALQIALVDLMSHFKISPQAAFGHSSGEIATAYCTGALDHISAIKVAYFRGKVSEEASQDAEIGAQAMLATGLSATAGRAWITKLHLEDSVFVGCLNSPDNTTLTGLAQGIDRLKAALDDHKIFARKLSVSCAYHSPLMANVAATYEALIQGLKARENPKSKINTPKVYSSVTGGIIDSAAMSDPRYWVRNLLSPVNFLGAVELLLDDQKKRHAETLVFIELGPHAALRRPLLDTAKARDCAEDCQYVSALRQLVSSRQTLHEMAGSLFSIGSTADFVRVNQLEGVKPVSHAPQYPFNHAQQYDARSRLSKWFVSRARPKHELVGVPDLDWNQNEPSWRNVIKLQENSWILDHKVGGSTIYPASGYLVMALEGVRSLVDATDHVVGFQLKDVNYLRSLPTTDSVSGTEARLHLRPRKTTAQAELPWYDFRVYALAGTDWVEACSGAIQAKRKAGWKPGSGVDAHQRVKDRCNIKLYGDRFYENLRKSGFDFGPSFRNLRSLVYNRSGDCSALLAVKQWRKTSSGYPLRDCVIHPAVLDGIMHLTLAGPSEGGWKIIPPAVAHVTRDIWISADLLELPDQSTLEVSSELIWSGMRERDSNMYMVDPVSKTPLVVVQGHRGTSIGYVEPSASVPDELCHRLTFAMDWKPALSLLSNEELYEYLNDCKGKGHWTSAAVIQQTERLVHRYIVELLPEAIKIRSGGVAQPHMEQYVAWMTDALTAWETSHPPSEKDQDPVFQKTDHDNNPSIAIAKAVGENLTGILRGDISAHQVLFETPLIEEWYEYTMGPACHQAATYLQTLAHERPSLKFCEIGAGTGIATAHILEALSHNLGAGESLSCFSEYAFTDISPAFLERAKDKFSKYSSRMKFQLLDISKDPSTQDSATGTYDIVVANLVLHATPDIFATLQNVRKLLRPGGKLVLVEQTRTDRLISAFVSGLWSGWWCSEDAFRRGSPLLSEFAWNDVLKSTGFSGIDLSMQDFGCSENSTLSMMVSSAEVCCSDIHIERSSSAPTRHAVILTSGTQFQKQVATGMVRSLEHDEIVEWEVTCASALQGLRYKVDFVVVLMDLDSDYLGNMNDDSFKALQHIFTGGRKVIWASRGAGSRPERPERAKIEGLMRCVAAEVPDLSCTVIALDLMSDASRCSRQILQVVQHVLSSQDPIEPQYNEEHGVLHIGRFVPHGALEDTAMSRIPDTDDGQQAMSDIAHERHMKLQLARVGALDSLHHTNDITHLSPLAQDEVEVRIMAVGLGYRDAMVAAGQLPSESLGYDAAGVISRTGSKATFSVGDHVMCFRAGIIGSFARCKPLELCSIPREMPFARAASLPTSGAISYHALHDLGCLGPESSILIHCGAGGTGQTAIQLAQHIGCTIFVTAGTFEKRFFLQREYGLVKGQIFSSRDTSFCDQILALTGGAGVDLVLSCVTGDMQRASLSVLAAGGTFVDLAMHTSQTSTILDQKFSERGCSFHRIDRSLPNMKRIFKRSVENYLKLMRESDRLKGPLPLHEVGAGEAEPLFRRLLAGEIIGKAILSYENTRGISVQSDNSTSSLFRSDATYVIVGGFGGIGRALVPWMLRKGARHFLLLSRSGAVGTAGAPEWIKRLEQEGALIEAPRCDVSDHQSLKLVLDDVGTRFPPVKGCWHAGMLVRDGLLQNLSRAEFELCLPIKITGSWNLHDLLPPDLDFFVLLSSLAGAHGNASQSPYACGNTYQDALVRHRRSLGLSAISVDVSLILDTGLAAESGFAEGLLRAGHRGMREEQLLAIFSVLCDKRKAGSLVPSNGQIVLNSSLPSILRQRGLVVPEWLQRPSCSILELITDFSQKSPSVSEDSKAGPDYLPLLEAASSEEEKLAVIVRAVTENVSKYMDVPDREIDTSRPFYEAGVDSLTALEIRTWFSTSLRLDVPVQDILMADSILSACRNIAQHQAAAAT